MNLTHNKKANLATPNNICTLLREGLNIPILRILLIISLASWSLTSQGNDEDSKSKCDILQVSVLSSNKVLLFGIEIGIDELSEVFQNTATNKGSVLYYRENPASDPQAISAQILQMVIDNQLPIRLSQEADFSDLLYENGNLRPR